MRRLAALCAAVLILLPGAAASAQVITVDVPGSVFTEGTGIAPGGAIIGGIDSIEPNGINARGDIVGVAADASGRNHGFLLNAAGYSLIDVPSATLTQAQGINARADIVGSTAMQP